MLPTTQKIAMGRQNHVPVLHHRLPIYEILCAPHPIETTEAPEKKKKKFITNTDNTEAENAQITNRQSTRSPLKSWEHPSTG